MTGSIIHLMRSVGEKIAGVSVPAKGSQQPQYGSPRPYNTAVSVCQLKQIPSGQVNACSLQLSLSAVRCSIARRVEWEMKGHMGEHTSRVLVLRVKFPEYHAVKIKNVCVKHS